MPNPVSVDMLGPQETHMPDRVSVDKLESQETHTPNPLKGLCGHTWATGIPHAKSGF